jgi:hypothetical protein
MYKIIFQLARFVRLAHRHFSVDFLAFSGNMPASLGEVLA